MKRYAMGIGIRERKKKGRARQGGRGEEPHGKRNPALSKVLDPLTESCVQKYSLL